MGQHGRFRAREFVMIDWREGEEEREREREEIVGVLISGASWRQICRDGHTIALIRGGRWCSDGEMVPNVRRMSRGGCSG
jgi:hypothetical protein